MDTEAIILIVRVPIFLSDRVVPAQSRDSDQKQLQWTLASLEHKIYSVWRYRSAPPATARGHSGHHSGRRAPLWEALLLPSRAAYVPWGQCRGPGCGRTGVDQRHHSISFRLIRRGAVCQTYGGKLCRLLPQPRGTHPHSRSLFPAVRVFFCVRENRKYFGELGSMMPFLHGR